jgi:hypothetical protein
MKHQRTAETTGAAQVAAGKFSGSLFAPVHGRPFLRECLIFLAFIALTALMSWPWARHPLDTVSDLGDPYNIAYTLWWDFHQTFHDPRHLFDATIFYPYRDTLAFSEHDYGIALLFFPLFAVGVPPLTVHSLATFFAFVLSGYGAFRLARTLTGSYGAAWVAGVAFAFIPYRFQRLPHLHYIFAGWIPLLFEASVLFVRGRSLRRAVWLGVAFLMNALTCITWFILALIPLGLSAAFLVVWYGAWRVRALWLRGAFALGAASLVLLLFLLPYRRVAAAYGFVRDAPEVKMYSATALNWLAASPRLKIWEGFGGLAATEEMSLFPGLLLPLLAFAALILLDTRTRTGDTRNDATGDGERDDNTRSRERNDERRDSPHDDARNDTHNDVARSDDTRDDTHGDTRGDTRGNTQGIHGDTRGTRRNDTNDEGREGWKRFAPLERFTTPAGLSLLFLDAFAVGAGLCALLISAYGTFDFRIFDWHLATATRPEGAFVACLAAVVARACVAFWRAARRIAARSFGVREDADRSFETFVLGAIWLSIGFLGSLGLHAFFHRFLFEHFEVFKSQRVPARWAMVCYVGLAVLAGLGARSLAQLFAGRRRRQGARRASVYAVLVIALLFELRVAPLHVVRGEAYPDELTLRLKETPMRGGLVELPVPGPPDFERMVRAADHGKPIVTATSSFLPPIMQRIESMLQQRPVPVEFLDLLESIPASYLVLHYSRMTPEERTAIDSLLRQGLQMGRLRFIRSYQDRGRKDLYAITSTEPAARTEAPVPPELVSPGEDGAK